MSIPTPSVPAAQAFILAGVQAQVATDPDATDVLVCIGDPSTDAPNGIISIASEVRRTVAPDTFVGGGGPHWLEEKYDISCVVSVAQETINVDTDALAVTARAWQLIGYVETAVRSDPSLGGAVDEAYPSSSTGGAAVWSPNNVGRICEITLLVHCEKLN